jgi:microcystin degradation protein MlrC
MARIAIAGFLHETNTFAPLLTTFDDFYSAGGPYADFILGEEMFEFRGKSYNRGACGFLNKAESLGHNITPIIYAAAEPSNQVTESAFERIMGVIALSLSNKGPFDGLFLDLHGAMVYENYQDGETEILRRVRKIVGDIPIVVSLDLHGNITRETFDLASILVGYRTYPHTDVYQTGERCALVHDHILRGNHVFKAFRQIPFLMPLTRQSTNTEPCRSIYALIDELERNPEVVSCSIMAGFAPADMFHTGPTVFTYGASQAAADQAADDLFKAIMDRESDFSVDLLEPREAVEKAIRLTKINQQPVILADIQDNAGAGGTTDTPWVLEALVEQVGNVPRTAMALMNDPQAAQAAHGAGEGATIKLELGGKLTPGQKPFVGTFLVKRLFDGEFIATGPMFNGVHTSLGKMANLQIGNIEVVVVSRRTQANDQSYFRQVGIEPSDMDILVLKSSNHYRADFEPISSAIIEVEAPGAFNEDARKTPYQNLRDGVRLMGSGPAHKRSAKH